MPTQTMEIHIGGFGMLEHPHLLSGNSWGGAVLTYGCKVMGCWDVGGKLQGVPGRPKLSLPEFVRWQRQVTLAGKGEAGKEEGVPVCPSDRGVMAVSPERAAAATAAVGGAAGGGPPADPPARHPGSDQGRGGTRQWIRVLWFGTNDGGTREREGQGGRRFSLTQDPRRGRMLGSRG